MTDGSDEWPPDPGSVSLYAQTRRGTAASLGVTDALRALRIGDQVLWPDRKQPLEVTARSSRAGNQYDSGMWEPCSAWRLEGARGGEYFIGNWWAWDEPDSLDNATIWPNVYRTSGSGWDSETKPQKLATIDSGHWMTTGYSSDHPALLDNMVTVVYEKATDDATYIGHVTDIEFEQPIVERVYPFAEDGDNVNEAVPLDDITAYRYGGDDE